MVLYNFFLYIIGNNSNGRTPSVENLTNLDHLPPPPVYREATRSQYIYEDRNLLATL